MWFTFVGSWFSFLVQCYCLTVYHDLQLPGRLEIILRIRTGPTGRFSYGSGSNWAASCPLGCGCGCKCSIYARGCLWAGKQQVGKAVGPGRTFKVSSQTWMHGGEGGVGRRLEPASTRKGLL